MQIQSIHNLAIIVFFVPKLSINARHNCVASLKNIYGISSIIELLNNLLIAHLITLEMLFVQAWMLYLDHLSHL